MIQSQASKVQREMKICSICKVFREKIFSNSQVFQNARKNLTFSPLDVSSDLFPGFHQLPPTESSVFIGVFCLGFVFSFDCNLIVKSW